MTTAEDDRIPKDHPIQQVWKDNAAGLDEWIKTLEAGADRDLARRIIGSFILHVHLDRPPDPRIMRWLAEALKKILAGVDPAVALGFSDGTQGRSKKTTNERYKEAWIAYEVLRDYEEFGKLEAALATVAERHNMPRSTVKAAYDKYKPSKEERIAGEVIKAYEELGTLEAALATVAERLHVSRVTAKAAYDKYKWV